ncbi:MAG: glycoside hydrolase family 88 protein [Lachnospiraceae bacterium]|nr:glycoside hydrolase family 88 protein [Lachnospiraceae bacterium]
MESLKKYFLGQVDRLITDMKGSIPGSQSKDYCYYPTGGKDWTDGFWGGMLNLAYEYSGHDKYKEESLKQVDILYDRIVKKEAVNHHDMGFLYSPSCLASYGLYQSEKALEAAILAADNLISRFREKGEFIQAWGAIDNNPNSYRLIIDCLLNLPLLYKVSELTGKRIYAEIAEKHFRTAAKYVIREDFSTNHTYYFDIETGAPLRATTVQGYSDNSMWARGQGWGIYGLALNYKYLKDDSILEKFNGVTDAFFNQLPEDKIPYWDMIFTEGNEPRDTSAASIAICGILEMEKYHPNPEYKAKALEMLEALRNKQTTEGLMDSNGLIMNSMYNRKVGHQPECSIWGDYYAMEALHRSQNPDWNAYW